MHRLLHRGLLRRALSTPPSFTEAAAKLARAQAPPDRARRRDARAAAARLAAKPPRPATHKRAASVVLRKAEARVEHALARAITERQRHNTWRPPLDAVEVSSVRLAPDFREAMVTWRLAEAPLPPRSRFFADAGPAAQSPDRIDAVAAALARVAGGLRMEVARRVQLQFAPALVFRNDVRKSAEGFEPEHLAELVAEDGLGRL